MTSTSDHDDPTRDLVAPPGFADGHSGVVSGPVVEYGGEDADHGLSMSTERSGTSLPCPHLRSLVGRGLVTALLLGWLSGCGGPCGDLARAAEECPGGSVLDDWDVKTHCRELVASHPEVAELPRCDAVYDLAVTRLLDTESAAYVCGLLPYGASDVCREARHLAVPDSGTYRKSRLLTGLSVMDRRFITVKLLGRRSAGEYEAVVSYGLIGDPSRGFREEFSAEHMVVHLLDDGHEEGALVAVRLREAGVTTVTLTSGFEEEWKVYEEERLSMLLRRLISTRSDGDDLAAREAYRGLVRELFAIAGRPSLALPQPVSELPSVTEIAEVAPSEPSLSSGSVLDPEVEVDLQELDRYMKHVLPGYLDRFGHCLEARSTSEVHEVDVTLTFPPSRGGRRLAGVSTIPSEPDIETCIKGVLSGVVVPGSSSGDQTVRLRIIDAGRPDHATPMASPTSGEEDAELSRHVSGDSPAAGGRPVGHCMADEVAYFSCTVDQGKRLSVCGSPVSSSGSGWLQYRFGRLDSIELAYPEDREYRWFSYEHVGDSEWLSFKNGAYQFRVVSPSGSIAGTDFAGVVVERDGRRVTRKECKVDGLTGNLAALGTVLTGRPSPSAGAE